MLRSGTQLAKRDLKGARLFSSETMGASHHGVSGADTKTYWEVEDKTSISFSMEDAPGVLQRALNIFTTHGINLTRIQSRPPKMIEKER